jgi:hypothetical protein
VSARLAPESLRALVKGAEAFDAERYFEAHEVWEDAWRVETGPARLPLQAVIQIAAAFHKGLAQGNPGGMVRLLERGLLRLEGLGEATGLDAFRREVRVWLDLAHAWAAGGRRPAVPPPRLSSEVAGRSGSDLPKRS